MLIDLSKSNLFTKDPDIRFSREYMVPLGTWRELWRRYKLLGYSNGDMRDYLFIKLARNLSYNSMDRWIMRSEIYSRSQPAIQKGARMVNTEIFGDHEQYVIDELSKQLRYGVSKNSRSII